MLAPASVPADSLHLVDRIVDRNARLIVRLTQVQRELHEARDHAGRWPRCHEETCRKTRACIEQNTLEGGV